MRGEGIVRKFYWPWLYTTKVHKQHLVSDGDKPPEPDPPEPTHSHVASLCSYLKTR